jgi:hypothetical protein
VRNYCGKNSGVCERCQVQQTQDLPYWFADSREVGFTALSFGQMTQRLYDTLKTFVIEHRGLRISECFSSRFYLGKYGSSRDPQTVVVEMHPECSVFPRASRTYAQLNEAPERMLSEMLREIEEGMPTTVSWMAL